MARALTACGSAEVFNTAVARPYFAEAIDLARALGDSWRLSQILGRQAHAAFIAGDPKAVAYAQRGHGERKRPSSGWDSVTPTGLDVVRLVAEGIPNKDIASRLFVSPRTVQVTSAPRLQQTRADLAREAARHNPAPK